MAYMIERKNGMIRMPGGKWFLEPIDVADGEARRKALRYTIASIEEQLDNHARMATFTDSDAYYNWRARAAMARMLAIDEARVLGHWMYNEIRAQAASGIPHSERRDPQDALEVSPGHTTGGVLAADDAPGRDPGVEHTTQSLIALARIGDGLAVIELLMRAIGRYLRVTEQMPDGPLLAAMRLADEHLKNKSGAEYRTNIHDGG